jgi:hypothetical protein
MQCPPGHKLGIQNNEQIGTGVHNNSNNFLQLGPKPGLPKPGAAHVISR